VQRRDLRLEDSRHVQRFLQEEAGLLLRIDEKPRLPLELDQFQPFAGDHGPAVARVLYREMARLRPRRRRTQAATLWAATYVLLGLRYSADLAEELLRGVLSMKESVTYQAILREGRAEGALDEVRRVLLLQGENLFGAPPDAKTRAALERIRDVERLEALSLRLLTASGWHDLLGVPASRRRHDRRSPG
jgi:predicted transposase YdaD